jgi:ATP-binding cassette subfamily B protein
MNALLAQLGPAFLRHRRAVAWGIACVLLTNLLALAQPQVLRFAVDDLYKGVTAEKLGRYAIILFSIALVAGGFKFGMRMALLGVSRHIEYDLRNQLFDRLLLQPAAFFQSQGVGDLVARSTNDLAAVRMMLGPGVMYLVNTMVVTVASLAFMLAISPRLTLVSLLPLPFVSLAMWFFGERIHRVFEGLQEQFARVSARAQENLAGVRVVRALAREDREREEFRALCADHLERQSRLTGYSSVFQPTLAFLSGVAALLALYFGGRQVIARQITLGQFVAFTVYLGMLNWPMVALGWVINLFQRGAASHRRLREILEAEPAITSPAAPRVPATTRGEIEVRRLTFAYPGSERNALRDVSFRVAAGSRLAVVGPTGSGKSTLLALLTRAFDPPPGTIFLDGVDVRDYGLAELRSRFALAPQDVFLFSATVAENVALGQPGRDGRAVERAVAVAGLTADVAVWPRGLETPVGERGGALSGGQRQRVAIARAVRRDAPVLLLDDALSSVDAPTEERILRALRELPGRRTTLLVSHRAPVVESLETVLVLEDGAIAELGEPEKLRARDGAFSRWLREQQIEAELEAS